MSKSKHVVKNGKNWSVKSDGSVLSTHKTQADANKMATQMAKIDRSEVVVHGRDGRIREKNSYGNDPFPPKG